MSGKSSGSIVQNRIKEVKHFQCSDGEVFSDRNDAVSYESALRRFQLFQDLAVEIGVPETLKERVVQGLLDNKTLVIKLLGETNKRMKNYRKVTGKKAKRGPGRPRKDETVQTAEKPKRGVGRPRKNEVEGNGDTPWGDSKELTKIMNVVSRAAGPCTKSKISQNTHIPAKPLKKFLKTLCSEGHLSEAPTPNNIGHLYTVA